MARRAGFNRRNEPANQQMVAFDGAEDTNVNEAGLPALLLSVSKPKEPADKVCPKKQVLTYWRLEREQAGARPDTEHTEGKADGLTCPWPGLS
ncbi:hypothetical protein HaLaN_01967 [Haematococcus lacustris]|uniref:Uncharacterized protein n=1 Tax=Haematococcus lacustris TaxID=44745 RepID=A0A699YMB2_HAELA|nr:hypothetical protein HaLaN_01967 [Haematococcus lacustris]